MEENEQSTVVQSQKKALESQDLSLESFPFSVVCAWEQD